MKTKGFLICFTGMDGTGKTTFSKQLVEILNEKGVKCKYVYGKLKPFILIPFIALGDWIFLHGRAASENYLEYSNTKRTAIKKHSVLSRIYQRILLLDYVIQIFFKVKCPLVFRKNIICDRYIYDTVITDLSVDMNYSKDRILSVLSKLLRLFPEPDMTFLIDVSEEIAYDRKNDTPSIKYLRERRDTYLNIGKEYGMVILDGTKKLEDLQCEIEKAVGKCL